MGGQLVPYLKNQGLETRSQNLPPAYIVNGSFYLSTPDDVRAHRSLTTLRSIPLVIESPEESLDIDTPWDFKIAEFIAECL